MQLQCLAPATVLSIHLKKYVTAILRQNNQLLEQKITTVGDSMVALALNLLQNVSILYGGMTNLVKEQCLWSTSLWRKKRSSRNKQIVWNWVGEANGWSRCQENIIWMDQDCGCTFFCYFVHVAQDQLEVIMFWLLLSSCLWLQSSNHVTVLL